MHEAIVSLFLMLFDAKAPILSHSIADEKKTREENCFIRNDWNENHQIKLKTTKIGNGEGVFIVCQRLMPFILLQNVLIGLMMVYFYKAPMNMKQFG